MKAVSGAILILASTVLFGGAIVAEAILAAGSRLGNHGASGIAILAAVVLGLFGSAILLLGLVERREDK